MSDGNGFATRDLMLRPLVRRFEEVEISGWGKFRIRSLTELERSRFEATVRDKKGNVSSTKLVDVKCRLIALCVVDGEGNTILTNSDIEQLRRQDAKYTNALFDEIQEHVGITESDLEDLEKNLEATAGSSSH